MNKFLEMQTFNAVVEAGSFVKAADALNLSKAAVSRHVVDLERRLGIRLLHRTTRRVSLTTEGQAFYTRSKDVLSELQDMESEMTSKQDKVSGLLRINAPFTFGIQHLAPLWGKFREAHPQVTLDVTLSDRVVDLVEEGYDLAIRIAALESSSLVSRRLASTKMTLCASPAYLKKHDKLTKPADLTSHQVIGYSYLSSKDEWHFTGPDGHVSVMTKPWMHTNNGETCKAAALAHQGIILQPRFVVGPELDAGKLVEILPKYRTSDIGIYAVY
ncbi:MAG: LysR family transcriptional regulator, partial [Actinobacteria bacterium]|nr:LysR family transcriptional regulator [Actinomycetota bacterium]